MAATRRESSADSAARFLAARRGRPHSRIADAARAERARLLAAVAAREQHWMTQVDLLAASAPPGRVVIDIGRATLKRIHDLLIESMHADADHGRLTDHLTFVAEQMVAQALGMPPCDDPPLTDREVR